MDGSNSKYVNLKVYFEGIEFPATSVSIQQTAGKGPTASLSLPVDEDILNFLPGTLVHIFYFDDYLNKYVLIFEGEMEAINLFKNKFTTSINVNCTNIFKHWSNAIGGGDMSTIADTSMFNNLNLNLVFPGSGTQKRFSNFPKDIQAIIQLLKDLSPGSLIEEGETEDTRFSKITFGYAGNTFFNSFKKYAEDEGKSLIDYIIDITNEYARVNVSYSIFQHIYKIANRISGYIWEGFEKYLQNGVSMEILINRFSESDFSNIPLSSVLRSLLETLLYKPILSSSPTYNKDKTLQSFYVFPDNSDLLPPACNVWFDNQVNSYSFTKDFNAGYTRVAITEKPTVVGKMDKSGIEESIANIIIVPNIKLMPASRVEPGGTKIQPNDYILSLTEEERLRGVSGVKISRDLRDILLNSSEEREEKDTIKEQIRYAEKVFSDNKYAGNTISMEVSYSPYRLCGINGVYISDSGKAMVGNILSISTSFAAGGQSSSNVTMSDIKIFNLDKNFRSDNYTENDYKNLLGIDSGADLSIDYLRSRAISKQVLYYPNHIYKEDLKPKNIGKKLYKHLIYGLKETETFPPDSYENKKFGNDPDGGISKKTKPDFRPFWKEDSPDIDENDIYKFYYFQYLCDTYESYLQANSDYKNLYADKYNARNIVGENEFWEFLIGFNHPSLDIKGRSVRKISNKSIYEEFSSRRDLIKETAYNRSCDPFVYERRVLIKNLLRKRRVLTNLYVGKH